MPIRSDTSKVQLPTLQQGLTPWGHSPAEVLCDAIHLGCRYRDDATKDLLEVGNLAGMMIRMKTPLGLDSITTRTGWL